MADRKPKILVVDDEEMVRAAIEAILLDAGYCVEVASSGDEAIARFHSVGPDVVLCDINMPGMDGYQILDRLRGSDPQATVPFLFLTGYSDRNHFRQGMGLGADDYLLKPVSRDELVSAVERQLQKRQVLARKSHQELEQLRVSISLALPHELHTPLHGILGFSEILLKEFRTMPPEEIADVAHRIHSSAERLRHLVENFLIYAQIELLAADRQQLESLRTERTSDVDRLVALVARQVGRTHNRTDDLRISGDAAHAAISQEYLSRIVQELADNGMKFSSPGSPVTVRVTGDGAVCRIVIEDRGRGMSEEELRSTGGYVQFNRKMLEQKGSGLGLTIARRLAEIHRGSLRIESTENRGTTVTVELPVPA